MTLEPRLTDKQLLEIAQRRQRERYGRVLDLAITVDADEIHRARQPRSVVTSVVMVPPDCPVRVRRFANGCHVTINLPPRTKKNHGRAFGIKQSAAYKHFRDTIVNSVALWQVRAQLPLEDRPYNLAAVYYVDSKGKAADLFGLHDGLADALQNAGVVSRDWWFRTADGSRVVFDDPNPRVEALITAIEGDL